VTSRATRPVRPDPTGSTVTTVVALAEAWSDDAEPTVEDRLVGLDLSNQLDLMVAVDRARRVR
jgi:hypothetical protein